MRWFCGLPVLIIFLTFSVLLVPAPTLAAPEPGPDIPDAAEPVPGSLVPVEARHGIRVTAYKGEWSAFFSMGGGSEAILLITGSLENTRDTPLSYVKFQYELLGENGIVVFRDYGYNRKAEVLRDEDYESGKVSLADKGIETIGAKEEERFRFVFFKKEIPELQAFRIRVVESK